MEEQPIINKLFGKSIYKNSIKNHESINEEIIPHIEKFAKEKPGLLATTTDTLLGDPQLDKAVDNLHQDEKYRSLFKKLQEQIKEFFNAKGYSAEKFDIHVTKSWIAYSIKGQCVPSHKHTASHYSCCYYVRNNEMGNLKIEQDYADITGFFIPSTDEYFSSWNQFNFASYVLPVKTGDFVIFPSGMVHSTEINTKNEARISIASDILFTMKKGVSAEHCIPHPHGWLTVS